MEFNKFTITIVLAVLLVGCGSDQPEEAKAKVEVIILQDQLKALEKAKSVEKTLLDAEAKRKEELQKQGI
ncbi:MAG: hypothetical protein ACJAYF_003381 [Arenicella sp.]